MANKVFQGRNASVRIYDETPVTPLFVVGSYIGDMDGPIRQKRPEETPQVNNGVLDAKVHHTIATDARLMEKPEITLSGKTYTTDFVDDLLEAMSNPFEAGTWSPGGVSTFITVTTLGTVTNADGAAITLPPPVDSVMAASLTNFEILWDGDANWGLRYQGVYWDPDRIRVPKPEEGDASWSATGVAYGAISKIVGFTAGAEIA